MNYLKLRKYDKMKDGVISMEEFKLALAEFNYTDEELNDMFRKMVRNMYLLMLCILISPLTLAVIFINSHLAETIRISTTMV
jgi:hypothetical protein